MTAVKIWDPRKLIRETIGTERFINNEDAYTITVTNNRGDSLYIPLYLPVEIHKETPPPLPYIEMKISSIPARTGNIGGDIHISQAYMDFDITYVPRTNIIDGNFGEIVAGEILDLIMTHRATVGMYMEVANDGHESFENFGGKHIIYHRIMEIYSRQMQKK